MAREPITSPITPVKKHHTFRNFMWLILFSLLLWAWFNYLPEQATQTMESARSKAGAQISAWLNLDTPIPQEVINTPIVIQGRNLSGSDNMSGEVMSGELLTGDVINTTMSGEVMSGTDQSDTVTAQWTAEQEANNTNNSGSESSVREQIDNVDPTSNPAATTSPSTRTINLQEPQVAGVISIQVGGQTIMIDGQPDEDIIINANGYRIIVQKN